MFQFVSSEDLPVPGYRDLSLQADTEFPQPLNILHSSIVDVDQFPSHVSRGCKGVECVNKVLMLVLRSENIFLVLGCEVDLPGLVQEKDLIRLGGVWVGEEEVVGL